MNKKALIIIAVLIVIGVVIYVFYKNSEPKSGIFGNSVSYDFNKDGVMDTAYITVDNSKGSGVFYYVTSSIKGTEPFLIGDRIAPQTTEVDAEGVVTVNYADRRLDESFSTAPSVAKSLRLAFDPEHSIFVNITDFELYTNKTIGFSAIIPKGFTTVEATTTVKFIIPKELATGTNLSNDSYIAVERGTKCEDVALNDAGAGNRYEEKFYIIPGSSPCLVAHYFIHYTAFENYPAGSIKEFDKSAIISLFNSIRKTIKL